MAKKSKSTSAHVVLLPKPQIFRILNQTGMTTAQAVAELVDNSVEADARRVVLTVSTRGRQCDEHTRLVVADDGVGIVDIADALALGSDPKAAAAGKSGCGMKLGASSIARRLVVVSRRQDGDGSVRFGVLDFGDMVATGECQVELGEFNPDADGRHDDESVAEARMFYETCRVGRESGTILVLDGCSGLRRESVDMFVQRLKAELGEMFRHAIVSRSGVALDSDGRPAGIDFFLKVNGEPVYAVDPLLRPETKPFANPAFVRRYPNAFDMPTFPAEKISFCASDGTKHEVRLTGTIIGAERVPQDRNGVLTTEKQGFYVTRNRRQVVAGATLGAFSRHPHWNRFRAEIEIGRELDSEVALDLSKSRVQLPVPLVDRLRHFLAAADAACAAHRRVVAHGVKHATLEHTAFEKKLAERSAELGLGLKSGVKPRVPALKFHTEELSALDGMWRCERKADGSVHVYFNTAHAAWRYMTADGPNGDGREGKIELMHCLAASFAFADGTQEDKRTRDALLGVVSDNMRKMLD